MPANDPTPTLTAETIKGPRTIVNPLSTPIALRSHGGDVIASSTGKTPNRTVAKRDAFATKKPTLLQSQIRHAKGSKGLRGLMDKTTTDANPTAKKKTAKATATNKYGTHFRGA
jgi:hypothetical protein